MTENRWRENVLDNELLLELHSDVPREDRVRELVQLGADVNSVKDGESVLMESLALTNNYEGTENNCLDLRFIRLLVELGADVNYLSKDGDSPLISACFTHRWEPVECILQLGANPNHVYDKDSAPLDWAEQDQCYHKEINLDETAAVNLKRTVELLKQYGAKHLDELFTDQPEHWLRVAAFSKTGLLTSRGNMNIASIQGASDQLIAEFRQWHTSNWDAWPDNNWDEMPKSFDRKAHNEQGRQLASKLRQLLPKDIEIEYLFVDADAEADRVRNVQRESFVV